MVFYQQLLLFLLLVIYTNCVTGKCFYTVYDSFLVKMFKFVEPIFYYKNLDFNFSEETTFVSFNSSCDLELFKYSFASKPSPNREENTPGPDTIYFNFTNNGLGDLDTLAIRFLPKFQKLAIMNGFFNNGSKTVTNDGFVTISLEEPYAEPSKGNSVISQKYKIEFLSNYINIYANGRRIYSINYVNLSENPKRFISNINGFTTSENLSSRTFSCSDTPEIGLTCLECTKKYKRVF